MRMAAAEVGSRIERERKRYCEMRSSLTWLGLDPFRGLKNLVIILVFSLSGVGSHKGRVDRHHVKILL